MKDYKLPPDPDGMNPIRSEAADRALRVFALETGANIEVEMADVLTDLLGNLRHLCDRHGLDFDKIHDLARDHYTGETSPVG